MAETETRNRNAVLVCYTGGTIGMVHSGNLSKSEDDSADVKSNNSKSGPLVPSGAFLRKELLDLCNQQDDTFPSVTFVQFDPVLDSSDMDLTDWTAIAKLVEKHYYEVDGFVILMGTDTMAYAASALSFMLQNLSKPVIFTGAMLPLFKGHSDARRNLLLSVELAGSSGIPEVCIFFHDRLLRGNRSKKVKSNALQAFDSPNFTPLALAGTKLTVNESLVLPHPRRKLKVFTAFDASVLVVKLIPGFNDDVFNCLFNSNNDKLHIKALVLELYGVGNAPKKKQSLLKVLGDAIERGVVVAVCSQCLYGQVDLMAYEVGKSLSDIGCISTYDMTVEAASTKLAYLLGLGQVQRTSSRLSYAQICAAMTTNLRGELTEPDGTNATAKFPVSML